MIQVSSSTRAMIKIPPSLCRHDVHVTLRCIAGMCAGFVRVAGDEAVFADESLTPVAVQEKSSAHSPMPAPLVRDWRSSLSEASLHTDTCFDPEDGCLLVS